MTTGNNTQFTTAKVVSKIVTFYTDGTFTEYVPAPMPQTYPPVYPYQPWWQGPVSNSQCWGMPTNECKTEDIKDDPISHYGK